MVGFLKPNRDPFYSISTSSLSIRVFFLELHVSLLFKPSFLYFNQFGGQFLKADFLLIGMTLS